MSRGRRVQLDWFEWASLAVLGALSFFFLAYLGLSGRPLTGAEGPVGLDQLQYMTWIREAGDHILIGNRWDLVADNRVFLHPGFLISGLVHRLTGLSLFWSYTLLWKPVAVVGLFGVVVAWVRQLVEGVWPRRVALFIALFVVMPWSGLLKFFGIGNRIQAYLWGLHLDFPSGEIWTIQPLHGYSMTVIALALMTGALLGVARAGSSPSWKRVSMISVIAMLVTWLQPWQGAELLLIIGFTELWVRVRSSAAVRWRLLPVFVFGSLPAAYYAWLGHSDSSWRLAAKSNSDSSQALLTWPWWAVLATFVPVVAPALLAYRIPSRDWGQVSARVWPLAALVVYFLPVGTFPFHAVQGIMIPLAVLIVQGLTVGRPRWLPALPAWLVVVLLAFFSVPGTIHKLWSGLHQVNTAAYPYTFRPGEQQALDWMQQSRIPGPVFTDEYGGLLVPAYSGREAYVGPFSWTPNLLQRGYVANAVFKGQIPPRVARQLILKSGARLVFQPCYGRSSAKPSLEPLLGSLLESVHQFGCARVYVLKTTSS